jgi:hypothetical protein
MIKKFLKKFSGFNAFNRLGAWAVPLVSVTSFVPILLGYGLSSSPQSTSQKQTLLPPLSQLPPAPQQTERQLMMPEPVTYQATDREAPTSKTKSAAAAKPHPPQATAKKVARKHSSKAHRSSHSPSRTATAYQAPPLEIQVAVVQDAPNTTLGTSQAALLLDSNGRVLQTLTANRGFSVQANGASLTVGDWQLPQIIWVQPTAGGFVFVGDRWYRGKLLLVSQGSTLLAVNYVDLEHYLYSVVGSEMHPTAPSEALKAQAIAARSYALVHMIRPASQWYHLGATQRWQVYKGVEREYNTSQKAVQETAGQVLSYRGGVVESLYAATDDIVARAHGGRGMSQIGAYELANQGYDYQQILDRYYPGVSLARLFLHQ